MTLKIQVFILFMFVFGLCVAKSELGFTEEDLSFSIEDSVFSVSGVYYFSSDKDMEVPIFYPFPEDTAMGEAYDIYIYDIENNKLISFKMREDKCGCIFVLNTNECNSVYISYKQNLFENYARYILLSTSSWGQALQRVEYKLKIPNDIVVTYFSIKPDNEINLDSGKIYFWQKENFMPHCDLIFKYKTKGKKYE